MRIQKNNTENTLQFAPIKPRGKFEVVFFPYKASMWDALESVYLAAKNSPECDVFVVPLPYFDKLPDGKLGQMHYEGSEYPVHIPITDYNAYDIKQRQPDVIFIHNPYDGGNNITSIPTQYYSEKLRAQTKCLCYIPYFVAKHNVGEHFITTAGCAYAHKVILQSEEIRDIYIRVFKEQYGDRFGKTEDKFVALGSPKFDKVINTKKEDCPLPDKWRKLIGNKKIILYNTTVTAYLRKNEQYLKHLRRVLEIFKDEKAVALWWRPHPLSKTTFESMRPKLLEEYNQIVENYKRESWGIYDDTANLHRAIAWSDGYYGSGGSVYILYEITGKPIKKQMGTIDNTIPMFINFVANGGNFNDTPEKEKKRIIFLNKIGSNSGNAGKTIYEYAKKQF